MAKDDAKKKGTPGRRPRTTGRETGASPARLPSGRHGLDPNYVVKNQRERIIAAIAQTVAELGGRSATTEDMVRAARVSRRTFYDLFESRDEAYLATYLEINTRVYERVAAAFLAAESGPDKLRGCLAAFLDYMASEPDFAYMAIVDVLSAGADVLQQRDQLLRRFVALVDQSGLVGPDDEIPMLASEAVVGGIYEVVYKRILAGETAQLRELLPELYYYCLVPFLGRSEGRRLYLEFLDERGSSASAAG